MERQMTEKEKNNEGVKEKSEVTTRIQTPNVLHGDLAFITLRYLNISYWTVKVLNI